MSDLETFAELVQDEVIALREAAGVDTMAAAG